MKCLLTVVAYHFQIGHLPPVACAIALEINCVLFDTSSIKQELNKQNNQKFIICLVGASKEKEIYHHDATYYMEHNSSFALFI